MCGFEIYLADPRAPPPEYLRANLCRARGPDAERSEEVLIAGDSRALLLRGYVLALRGPAVVPQPAKRDGNLLLWNGELFGGPLAVGPDENDTEVLLNALSQIVQNQHAHQQPIIINGEQQPQQQPQQQQPTLIDNEQQQQLHQQQSITIDHEQPSPIETNDVACQLIDDDCDSHISSNPSSSSTAPSSPSPHPSALLQLLDSIEGPYAFAFYDASARRLYFGRDRLGRRSLLYRTRPFALASVLPLQADLSLEQSIPLSFSSSSSIESASSIQSSIDPSSIESSSIESSLHENASFCLPGTLSTVPVPDQHFADPHAWQELPVAFLYALDLSRPDSSEHFLVFPRIEHPFLSLSSPSLSLSPPSLSILATDCLPPAPPFHPFGRRARLCPLEAPLSCDEAVARAHLLLRDAVARRVAGAGRVTLLFSGGLDSMLLAALCCDLLLPLPSAALDLLSVSFAADAAPPDAFAQAPDRLTAVAGFAELQRRRAWVERRGELRFVEVNVRQSEMARALRAFVPWLTFPQTTVMDATICAALWFACQRAAADSRVVLLGHGADELCAGYARHAQALQRKGGLEGLRAELDMDLARMWARNLGRDDRIIASLGKEARHPFLDERFASFVLSLPVEYVCDLALPKGTGDKRILRAIARDLLHMPQVATVPKRAIQFGSRIAKFLPKQGKQQLDLVD